MITVIKREILRSVPHDAEEAVATYRAFEPVARHHSARICDSNSLEIMLGVIDGIRNDLLKQKNQLQQSAESIMLSLV